MSVLIPRADEYSLLIQCIATCPALRIEHGDLGSQMTMIVIELLSVVIMMMAAAAVVP